MQHVGSLRLCRELIQRCNPLIIVIRHKPPAEPGLSIWIPGRPQILGYIFRSWGPLGRCLGFRYNAGPEPDNSVSCR
jgi:hypothetical protein